MDQQRAIQEFEKHGLDPSDLSAWEAISGELEGKPDKVKAFPDAVRSVATRRAQEVQRLEWDAAGHKPNHRDHLTQAFHPTEPTAPGPDEPGEDSKDSRAWLQAGLSQSRPGPTDTTAPIKDLVMAIDEDQPRENDHRGLLRKSFNSNGGKE